MRALLLLALVFLPLTVKADDDVLSAGYQPEFTPDKTCQKFNQEADSFVKSQLEKKTPVVVSRERERLFWKMDACYQCKCCKSQFNVLGYHASY